MKRGAALLLLLLLSPAARGELRIPRPTPAPGACFRESPDFEENLGQAAPAVRFLARGRGFLALFTDDGATFAGGGSLVRMGFPGARAGVLTAGGLRPGLSNYPPRVAGARHFATLERRDLWPGIDLRWSGGTLEYSFALAAGADPSRISLSFTGGDVLLDPAGDLLVGGFLRHRRPRAFQCGEEVAVSFLPRPDGTVGFAVGAFDPSLPLLVDPQVVFTAAHGGSDSDEAWAVAADPAGYLYFAGWAVSTNLPVTGAVFQGASAGSYDAFVVKRSPRGALLVYATYLGGSSADLAYALAVDDAGRAVVAGGTQSADFPTTAGTLRPAHPSGTETGFVAKLSASGSSLAWSTYVGGTVRESVRGITLRAGGDALLVGTTTSADFPAANVLAGASDAYVADLAADGTSLAWSTFLGGTLNDEGRSLAVGQDGSIFVAGTTESIDFPDKNAVKTTLTGARDAFLASLAPDGSAVNWATYLGGDGLEEGWGLAVDASGSPWIVGYTTSLNFPLVAAVDSVFGGQFEAFATKYAADGTSILVSTYLGGAGSDKAEAACADGAGVVYVVGRTSSPDFPLKDPLLQNSFYSGGDYDAFVTALAPGGTSILWSTYRGGGGSDFAMAATVDRDNAVVLAGRIEGTNGDGYTTAVIAVPLPPPSLTAVLTGNARVQLNWNDQGPDEDGYIVQRRKGNGPFADVKFLARNVVQYVDADLEYATTYTWRVIAYNAYGKSSPSQEATVTTLPDPAAPPAAPSNLAVTSFDTRRVNLTWTDNSADEDSFVLQRFDPYVGFANIATLTRNNTFYSDNTVLPLRDYRYRVLAVNARGPSAYSAEAVVTLDASFHMEILSGRRRTKPVLGKDTLVLSGIVAHEGDTRWNRFVPPDRTFEVRLGADHVPLVSLPAGYDGWVLKRGRWVLQYPFSNRGKLTIVVDPSALAFTLTLRKADLLDAPAGPEEVRLLFGEDGATFPVPWVPKRKAGDYRFP